LVILQDAGRTVGQVETGRNGAFEFRSVKPGSYSLTFKKPGLRLGTLDSVEVKPGKMNELEDRLVMSLDEGSLAFIRGSVFSSEGYSIEGAKVEIAKIEGDGSLKKLDSRLTGETGEFVFRLSPAVSKYRLTAKINGADPVSKDVEVDGAAVYRVAISVSKRK
jgi:protocatechuate 3,4-dioxygenase beta subunit